MGKTIQSQILTLSMTPTVLTPSSGETWWVIEIGVNTQSITVDEGDGTTWYNVMRLAPGLVQFDPPLALTPSKRLRLAASAGTAYVVITYIVQT
ncbi:MAG: hypothetical protein KatS3mg038_3642 [Candidatus Kapaibacterium sp.]|nr:MAG: hypothetical protein KatS3mg038_1134 [Candidatus Kapabacteria bacterium]GIV51820.1 MAG: hypothetical protein KatS3mg038_2341 [Candidatus Kapabacteria bacterium]GIV51984.1 MAG: hypothetical protein KatS3mg038_2505 [Candidatus Kapabacteria bacterium]GIV52257.1 MAG: hypothetical protein KatS3mg038_2778 [Candidatus Kapabacteria bacterium]GIV53121.1 MAG: hypothetical protein KatS3mg038_3642 [Candidatus Kapabacteria bacterium]